MESPSVSREQVAGEWIRIHKPYQPHKLVIVSSTLTLCTQLETYDDFNTKLGLAVDQSIRPLARDWEIAIRSVKD